MRELIEAGVHFGHRTKRWNPRMAPYLFGVRNDIHIIDLGKTVPMFHAALGAVRDVTGGNGRVLFVGTKRQAAQPIAEAAKRCGQYYINQRWLGGLLTNWSTIQNSIKTLKKLEEQLGQSESGFTKKEMLSMTRERDKLEASLGGIKDMGGLPDLIFIIDTTKEDLAVKEAQKLGIPVIAIVDSNASLDGITYAIPGNDDSTRAINLYCRLVSDAALSGIQKSLMDSGADIGASENLSGEELAGLQEAHAASKVMQAEKSESDEEGAKKGARGKGRAPAKKAPTVVTVKKAPVKTKKDESEE
jgi:small subunit ribosomal protein S2